jgi:hypothetical protein
MLISSEKYKKMKKKYMNSTVMYCSLTNKPLISVVQRWLLEKFRNVWGGPIKMPKSGALGDDFNGFFFNILN